jgi:hypothetical protein
LKPSMSHWDKTLNAACQLYTYTSSSFLIFAYLFQKKPCPLRQNPMVSGTGRISSQSILRY